MSEYTYQGSGVCAIPACEAVHVDCTNDDRIIIEQGDNTISIPLEMLHLLISHLELHAGDAP